MPRLKFICPASGSIFDTGMDIGEEAFAALGDDTRFDCPYCLRPDRIDEVAGWVLGDVEPELDDC